MLYIGKFCVSRKYSQQGIYNFPFHQTQQTKAAAVPTTKWCNFSTLQLTLNV